MIASPAAMRGAGLRRVALQRRLGRAAVRVKPLGRGHDAQAQHLQHHAAAHEPAKPRGRRVAHGLRHAGAAAPSSSGSDATASSASLPTKSVSIDEIRLDDRQRSSGRRAAPRPARIPARRR